MGHFVLEQASEPLGVVYTQRVESTTAVGHMRWATEDAIRASDGRIIQLLKLNSSQGNSNILVGAKLRDSGKGLFKRRLPLHSWRSIKS